MKDIQSIYIETLDRYWISHLGNLHHLREGISVRGYGQEDPYRLYSFDALDMFNNMLNAFSEISADTFYRLIALKRKNNKDRFQLKTAAIAQVISPELAAVFLLFFYPNIYLVIKLEKDKGVIPAFLR